MDFLERDLEDIIFSSNLHSLQQRGLDISGKRKRQVKIGNYGIADIITISKPTYAEIGLDGDDMAHHGQITITIFELKQNKIDVNTLMQSYRYKKGVSSYIQSRCFEAKVEIVLIGKSIEQNGDFPYLVGELDGVDIYTYNYLIDGIHFVKRDGFYLNDEGF